MGRTISTVTVASPIKSRQFISKALNHNQTSNSTISAVDTAKTIIVEAGQKLGFQTGADANVRARTCGAALGMKANLTSTTNVEFQTSNAPSFTDYAQAQTLSQCVVLEFV